MFVINQLGNLQGLHHIASPLAYECMVQGLGVGYNQFSGIFNALLGSCEYIVSFHADGNMLSGSLPANMASLGVRVLFHCACQFVPLVALHSLHHLPESMLL